MENNRLPEQIGMKLFLDYELKKQVESGKIPECLRPFAHVIPDALIWLKTFEKNVDEFVVGLDLL